MKIIIMDKIGDLHGLSSKIELSDILTYWSLQIIYLCVFLIFHDCERYMPTSSNDPMASWVRNKPDNGRVVDSKKNFDKIEKINSIPSNNT